MWTNENVAYLETWSLKVASTRLYIWLSYTYYANINFIIISAILIYIYFILGSNAFFIYTRCFFIHTSCFFCFIMNTKAPYLTFESPKIHETQGQCKAVIFACIWETKSCTWGLLLNICESLSKSGSWVCWTRGSSRQSIPRFSWKMTNITTLGQRSRIKCSKDSVLSKKPSITYAIIFAD